MKTRAVLFPTLFAILMAVSSIGFPIPGTQYGTPWLTAVHEQNINATGQTIGVDNIAFYLWGHQYTVVGKTMDSKFVTYVPGEEFPFYSMIAIIIAIITGLVAITSNRNYATVIRGKDVKLGFNTNPLTFIIASMALMSIATIYLYLAANSTIVPMLKASNYAIVEYSYGIKFMAISAAVFLISAVMTRLNYLSDKKEEEKEKEDEEVENLQNLVK